MGLFDTLLLSRFWVSGIIDSPIGGLNSSQYISELKNEFAKIQETNGIKANPGVGLLRFDKNEMLYPEYHYMQQDERHVIRCKTEPKPLDLLVFDEKIKKEIREKGYWIVQKYNI